MKVLSKVAFSHSKRTRVGLACSRHGYFSGDLVVCPKCVESRKNNKNLPHIKSDSWVAGWWEHIDKEPIYIESKKHLIQECEKRGVYAKAFVHKKSQGRGLEHK